MFEYSLITKISRFIFLSGLLLPAASTRAEETGTPEKSATIHLGGADPTAENIESQGPTILKNIDSAEEQNIYRHRDIYFMGGKPNAKVQLSFKLKPVLNFPVFFAYTQKMFWDTSEDSKPFEDINFNPELYYVHPINRFAIRTMSLGVEHISNGKSDAASRSLDRIFVEADSHLGYGTFRMLFSARFYWTYDIDWQTNRNIDRYSGIMEARINLEGVTEKLFPTKGEIYLSLLPGGNLNFERGHGAAELTVKYRMGLSYLMPYVMFQYYYGYMESLLKYDKLTHSYRIGFAL